MLWKILYGRTTLTGCSYTTCTRTCSTVATQRFPETRAISKEPACSPANLRETSAWDVLVRFFDFFREGQLYYLRPRGARNRKNARTFFGTVKFTFLWKTASTLSVYGICRMWKSGNSQCISSLSVSCDLSLSLSLSLSLFLPWIYPSFLSSHKYKKYLAPSPRLVSSRLIVTVYSALSCMSCSTPIRQTRASFSSTIHNSP